MVGPAHVTMLRVCAIVVQGTGGPGSGPPPQSGLAGISGIKVNPKDFEETTKRCVVVVLAISYQGFVAAFIAE